ncbi:MAG: Glyoxalase/bleomycin resistance protein/dioxygenase [Nocardioides sp.]|nr:Glyoxalase/bleomycin resistance protein/dioxygenase [Nocardioides sp.]
MPLSFTSGEPCWIDLFTADPETAADFYSGLFGWEAGEASPDFGGYRMFLRDGVPVAGLMPNDGSSGTPSTWSVYLATDDLDATTQRARAAGATVVAEPMAIADLGRMAVLVDPAGALVGAWQAGSFAGFGARAADGAPAWFETLTRDYDRAVGFYRDVFGWDVSTMSDTAEFRYTTLGKDQDARAGIMDATGFLGEDPSRWQFYLQVPDTDATVARAIAAGASVVVPDDDTPYGRVAVLRDPGGVQFNIMGPVARAR